MLRETNYENHQMKLALAPERRIFGVSELNAAVQSLFENEFRNIWVAGEISGCRAAASGHTYFSLKDEQSQIKCALFKGNARFAKFKPQDGMSVIARGSLEVYEARGEYQLIVELLEPRGAGALQLAFEQLKKKLEAEGLFEAGRKRALPRLPRHIGLVTSPAGAVVRDILHVLERRFAGLHIRLFPAQVQGEGAREQICAGLKYFGEGRWADVVIVARGGGSLEDLWTFNEEAVARAIAASAVPVISAIGHETDFTIADFVADVRAPTPSSAAELVVRSRQEFDRHIADSQRNLVQQMRYLLSVRRRRVSDLQHHRGFRQMEVLVHRRGQRVDELTSSLAVILRRRLATSRQRTTRAGARIASFDLRARATVLRRRIHQQRDSLRAALERSLTRKQRRFGALEVRFAA